MFELSQWWNLECCVYTLKCSSIVKTFYIQCRQLTYVTLLWSEFESDALQILSATLFRYTNYQHVRCSQKLSFRYIISDPCFSSTFIIATYIIRKRNPLFATFYRVLYLQKVFIVKPWSSHFFLKAIFLTYRRDLGKLHSHDAF